MGNLFSGKTTLMEALSQDPYKTELEGLIPNSNVHAFTERVEKGSLVDDCLEMFYENRTARIANIFPTEIAFLHMRTMQQREIRHLMTRHSQKSSIIIEDRPFLDGPEVFVKRMIKSGEMPAAHARLYKTLFYQTLHNERIRLPDLTVYLRCEPKYLIARRLDRGKNGDPSATVEEQYLYELHESYEELVSKWKQTLLKYQEYAIVPPDSELLTLPAEIDMSKHLDYVHVVAGTIREKVRRMIQSRK